MDTAQLKNDLHPTGRRYNSVNQLIDGGGFSEETQKAYYQLGEDTRITRALAALRAKAGFTQADMGERIGMSQSAISKLEAGRDEDLTLKEIRAYTDTLKERVGLLFGPSLNHAEAINLHAQAMKQRMCELAKIAGQDSELQKSVDSFLADMFSRLFNIVSGTMDLMPDKGDGIRIQLFGTPQIDIPKEAKPEEKEHANNCVA